MSKQPLSLTIGALANAAGVNVETIRYYQRKQLLDKPERLDREIRRYGLNDVARVKFIKAAQRLGFTLDEIDALLKLDDGTHCNEARGMAEQKLSDVRSKLRSLLQIETALATMVAECCATTGTIVCPLITSLQSDSGLLVK